MSEDRAALAAALSKAQAAFPPLLRKAEVDGRSYKFKYATLDAVFEAVREPLSKNGLAVSQLLDGDDLVTLLLHESGGELEGRVPLPVKAGDTVQQLGSAITYMRRYALQAILGIAAEEDDDAEAAATNKVKKAEDRKHPGLVDGDPPTGPRDTDGAFIGTVGKGAAPVDMDLRVEPDGKEFTGFVLRQGRQRLQVVAVGPLAASLQPFLAGLIDQRVSVWGSVERVPWKKGGEDMPPYQRLQLQQIQTDDWIMPPRAEAVTVPLFPDEAA